jgi:hypothetical protein
MNAGRTGGKGSDKSLGDALGYSYRYLHARAGGVDRLDRLLALLRDQEDGAAIPQRAADLAASTREAPARAPQSAEGQP